MLKTFALIFSVAMVVFAFAGCTSSPETEAAQVQDVPNPYRLDATEYDRMFEASMQVLRRNQYMIERSDYRFGVILTEPRGAAMLFEFWRWDHSTFEQAVYATANDLTRVIRVTIQPWQQEQLREWVLESQSQDEVTDMMLRHELSLLEEQTRQPMVTEIQSEAVPSFDEPQTETVISFEQDGRIQMLTREDLQALAEAGEAGLLNIYALRVEVLIYQEQNPEQYITQSATGQVLRDLDATPVELKRRGISGTYQQPIGRDISLESKLVVQIVQRAGEITDLSDYNFIQP